MPLSGPMTDEERRKRLRAIQTQFGIGTPGMGIAPMQGDARTQPRLLTPSPDATGRVDTGLAGVRQPEVGMGRLFGEEALGTVRGGAGNIAESGRAVGNLVRSGLGALRENDDLRLMGEETLNTVRGGAGNIAESAMAGGNLIQSGLSGLRQPRLVGHIRQEMESGLQRPVFAGKTVSEYPGVIGGMYGEGVRAIGRGLGALGSFVPVQAEQTAAPAPVAQEQTAAQAPATTTSRKIVTVGGQRVSENSPLARQMIAQQEEIDRLRADLRSEPNRTGAQELGPEGGILTPKGEIVSESDAQVAMMARQEADERAAALERDARTMRDREFQTGLGSGRVFNPITQQFDVAAPSTLVAAGTLGLPVRGGRMIDTETFRAPRIGAGLGSAREMRVAAGQGTGEERGEQTRRGLRDRAEAELMAGAQERTAQREQERGLVGMTNESKERIAQIESGRMTDAEKKRAWEQEDMRGVVDGMIDQIFAGAIRRPPKSYWKGQDTGSGEIFINLADNQLEELSKADYEAHIKDPSKKPHLAPVPEEVREYWESGTKRSRA